VCVASTAAAQIQNGEIVGLVADPSGAVLVNATVNIRNLETDRDFEARTNETGFYAAKSLAIGRYRLTVLAEGFTTTSSNVLTVAAGTVLRVDFRLTIGLRDPDISDLQWFLQISNSPLDDQPGTPDAETVFAQFEHDPEQNRALGGVIQPLAQSVAGLFKLIEIMASFDNLFGDLGELQFRSSAEGFAQVFEVYPESAGRFAIARATANFVSWRFNLRDQRTVNRLAIVMDAFWDICEAQLRQHLQPGVRWSSTGSYDALIAMLERWRDRADPEPDVEPISLSQLNRSVHNARERETQSQGLA
jgi:hypothetical protein